MNLKTFIKNFIALFTTAFILLFCFYSRFLIERLPHAIENTKNSYYTYILLCIIILLLISIYIQLTLVKKNLTESFISNNNNIISKIKLFVYNVKILTEFLINNLYDFCCFLFTKTITYHYLILINLGKSFIKLNNNPRLCTRIIIIFEIFPRVILNFAIFLDIFIFEYFYYSYKGIFILLLPLLLQIYVYMMRRLFFDFFSLTNNMLLKVEKENEDIIEYYYTSEFEKNPPKFVKNIDDFVDNHYFVLIKIFSTITYYNTIKNDKLQFPKIILFFTIFKLITCVYLLLSMYIL